jgi:hypothetical protein
MYNNGTYATIDPYGSTFVFPTGIDGNTIVGYYDDSSGVQLGFADTVAAVPEPSSFVLLAAVGIVALVAYGFRPWRFMLRQIGA